MRRQRPLNPVMVRLAQRLVQCVFRDDCTKNLDDDQVRQLRDKVGQQRHDEDGSEVGIQSSTRLKTESGLNLNKWVKIIETVIQEKSVAKTTESAQ